MFKIKKGLIRSLYTYLQILSVTSNHGAESHLKTTLGQLCFLCPKSQHFSRFGEKCLLDNTTGIRYLNPGRRLPQYGCCLISGPTTYGMLPATR